MWVAMKKHLLTSAVLSVLAASAQAEDNTVKLFDRMVISGSAFNQTASDSQGSVSIVTDDDLRRSLSESVADIFKRTPAVSSSGGMRGDGQINVRGLTGNRVLISIDGVRQAKALSWGSLNAGRSALDTNTLKQVEVIPGPLTALEDSAAMGGLVYYTTKQPEDVLRESGNSVGGEIKLAFDEASSTFSKSASVAGRHNQLEGLLIVTRNDGHETRTHYADDGTIGQDRKAADPADLDDTNLHAKLNIRLSEHQHLRLTAERVDIDDYTADLSSMFANASFADEKLRKRFSAEYQLEADTALFDQANLQLDWQNTFTDQLQRYDHPRWGAYRYASSYEEQINNVQLRLTKGFMAGGSEHTLKYGLDYEDTWFEQYRDSSKSGANRAMPRSDSESWAVFVQDQIRLADGALVLTPGVRYDRYTITPKPDAAYLASNPVDPNPAENKESFLGFQLGATYRITDQLRWFGQFAQGFKAPDMDEMYANYGRRGAYKFISNPDLEPEESNNVETGLRWQSAAASSELVVFYNDYDNFIDQVTLARDPDYPYGVFQQQNLNSVVIKGVELQSEVYLGQLSDHLQGFTLAAALAYAQGTIKEPAGSQPLESVLPLNGVFSLRYDAPASKWGTDLTLTAAKGKSASDVQDSADSFLPGGYGVIDLTGYYRVNKDIRIDAGIFNVGGKEYWLWETARSRAADAHGLSRLSEPDRHVRIAVNWRF